MARPTSRDWLLLKRLARYVVGTPRVVYTYEWQSAPSELETYADSDWAGCKSTRRSTSGGAATLGTHCVKSWSTTQAVVALSSAEAELYALLKAASQTLGLISLASDFGLKLSAKVHTDASAALGIVNRQGLGKLRHISVQYLWVQERVRSGDIQVAKIPGVENPADLLTKHLAANDMEYHMSRLGLTAETSRAATTPTLTAWRVTAYRIRRDMGR